MTKNKELHLHLSSLWQQPSVDALKWASGWMGEAQKTQRDNALRIYSIPNPDRVSMQMLVDIYAAALVLGLRPFPHQLRYIILSRVTNVAPMVAVIELVHERLPLDDSITTRTITAFFQFMVRRASTFEPVESDREPLLYGRQGVV